ncbi:MAG: hypothetical protein REI64_16635, partial [Pedobacter sp.]|uniref:hypothetical protein n=1 Tax=Pedobacter sp. TaxID=1411316 RepID=UPI002808D86F
EMEKSLKVGFKSLNILHGSDYKSIDRASRLQITKSTLCCLVISTEAQRNGEIFEGRLQVFKYFAWFGLQIRR